LPLVVLLEVILEVIEFLQGLLSSGLVVPKFRLGCYLFQILNFGS
jgi:hypothetical protein